MIRPGITVRGMHLSHVAVIVDDYDKAIRFFVDALGFELVEDSPATTTDGKPKRWVVVRPPGAETGLLLAKAAGAGRQFAGRIGLFLRVDNFEAQFERMQAAGVHFTGPIRTHPHGRVVVFYDVAGNRWDLVG